MFIFIDNLWGHMFKNVIFNFKAAFKSIILQYSTLTNESRIQLCQ
jgi:hypothetical protein